MNLLHFFVYIFLIHSSFNKVFVSGLITDSRFIFSFGGCYFKYCRQVAYYTGPTGMNLPYYITFGEFD